jgi:hypothetical protein
MTVRELIVKLEALPQELDVYALGQGSCEAMPVLLDWIKVRRIAATLSHYGKMMDVEHTFDSILDEDEGPEDYDYPIREGVVLA